MKDALCAVVREGTGRADRFGASVRSAAHVSGVAKLLPLPLLWVPVSLQARFSLRFKGFLTSQGSWEGFQPPHTEV